MKAIVNRAAKKKAANVDAVVASVPMAKDEKLLGTLVKMVLVEKIAQTRESAITALQNLAFTKENRVRLVQFKKGIVLETVASKLNKADFLTKSLLRDAYKANRLAVCGW